MAPYAVGYGLVGNTLLGAGVSTANAGFNNWYYQYDPTYMPKDLLSEAEKGAFGGYLGYKAGAVTTNYFTTPIIRNQPILLQNYNNPFPGLIGNAAGGGVSGATPIVIDFIWNLDKQK